MNWKIDFYKGVDEQILAMPPKIQARMLKLLELMERHGANLGPPHTDAMGGGLRAAGDNGHEGVLIAYDP